MDKIGGYMCAVKQAIAVAPNSVPLHGSPQNGNQKNRLPAFAESQCRSEPVRSGNFGLIELVGFKVVIEDPPTPGGVKHKKESVGYSEPAEGARRVQRWPAQLARRKPYAHSKSLRARFSAAAVSGFPALKERLPVQYRRMGSIWQLTGRTVESREPMSCQSIWRAREKEALSAVAIALFPSTFA